MNAFNNATEEVFEIASRTTIFPMFHNDTTMKKFFKAIRELRDKHADDVDIIAKLDWLQVALKEVQIRIKHYGAST
ncbi:hypothetical protein D3C86_2122630 [compost metagenome]